MSTSEMQVQRDRALACLILAVCITGAVFISVFGKGETITIENARGAVVVHEALLRQSSEVLQQNQNALGSIRAALAGIERTQRR